MSAIESCQDEIMAELVRQLEAAEDFENNRFRGVLGILLRKHFPAEPVTREHELIRQAAQAALEHVTELRDAWMRGALSEHDGLGGTRSNRNADVERRLYQALNIPADQPAAYGGEEENRDR